MVAQLLVGPPAPPHRRLRQLPDGGGAAADPRRLRHQEVRPAANAETQVRPGQLLPHEPEHRTSLVRCRWKERLCARTSSSTPGVTLRGWLHLPDGAGGPVPTVVMAHGLSAVKEMPGQLRGGLCRRWAGGAGVRQPQLRRRDGEPRQEIDPWAQVRDYRRVITWARLRPEVVPTASACGGLAMAAATCWCSGRSTSASSASPPRCRWSPAWATSSGWSARASGAEPGGHGAGPRRPLPG